MIEQELELQRLVDEASKPEILQALLMAEADIDNLVQLHLIIGTEVTRMQLVKACWCYWYIIGRSLTNSEQELSEDAG